MSMPTPAVTIRHHRCRASIALDPENSGGGITVAEASRGTPVVVGLAGTGAAVGDTLTVNWGGQTVNYTLLAATSRATARR